MMDVDITSRDLTSIPAALLPPFKQHGRIDTGDDDDLIKGFIARAADQFERNNEYGIFETSLTYYPGLEDFWANYSWDCPQGYLKFPITPVNSVTVVDAQGADLADQSGYQLRGRGVFGVRIFTLAGAFFDGMSVKVTTGYKPDKLPPGILDVLMRMTQHLYDHRELYLAANVDIDSTWLNQIVANYWLPRA